MWPHPPLQIIDFVKKPSRIPQFSVRWLLARMAAVSVICAATGWWVNHVRRVDAEYDMVPLRTVHVTIFLAILLLGVVFTVIVVPPMCIAVTMIWTRCRRKKKE